MKNSNLIWLIVFLCGVIFVRECVWHNRYSALNDKYEAALEIVNDCML